MLLLATVTREMAMFLLVVPVRNSKARKRVFLTYCEEGN